MYTKEKRERLKIARRIMFRREELGMSRDELALELGLSKSYVHDVEYGLKGISVKTLIKICQVLKVPADYLLFNTNKYLKENGDELDELRERIVDYLCDCSDKELEYAEKFLHVLIDTMRERRPPVKNV